MSQTTGPYAGPGPTVGPYAGAVPAPESPTAPPATADRWGSRGAETPSGAVPDPEEEDTDDVG